jgi:NAD(P)-dependent dehydrogenase (short-subunit alcohol dehydrogenase family)
MKSISSVRPTGFWINAGLATLAAYFFVTWFNTSSKLAIWHLQEKDVIKNVEGKDFLIVGGTKGIGHALMESLSRRGARVTITGRSVPTNLPKNISFIKSDVSTLKASRDLVRESLKGRTFDTVVFTVGIMSSPQLKRTSEGLEEDLATSYMSRFVIVNELLKVNALVGRKRVFIMGYPGVGSTPTNLDDINFEHTEYSVLHAHLNTVVFNEALVYELAKKRKDIHVFGLNPGIIPTGIRDNLHGGGKTLIGRVVEFLISLVMPTAEQYVERVVLPLVASPQLQKKTGVCFTKYGSVAPMHTWMADAKNRRKVWEASEKLMVKVLGDDPDSASDDSEDEETSEQDAETKGEEELGEEPLEEEQDNPSARAEEEQVKAQEEVPTSNKEEKESSDDRIVKEEEKPMTMDQEEPKQESQEKENQPPVRSARDRDEENVLASAVTA